VALAVVTAVLFAVGVHKNAQITSLRTHGVRVEVTASRCFGLLGGSGSNGAGYSCRGTYVLEGARYSVTIPGDTLRAPGSKVQVVAAENDPGLIASLHQAQSDHASWTVFLLPSVLLFVLLGLLARFAVRRRRDPGTVRSAGTAPGARLPRRQPLLR
jgi:MYXO-CTERM domain-containing protein